MRLKKGSATALSLALVVAASGAAAKGKPTEAPPAAPPALVALQKSLHPQTGDVRIPEAKAVLHLGERYYFLSAADAKRVLVEGWHNPPDAGEGVLGMVLEQGTTLYDNVWGAVITYRDTGHVSDTDAAKQDYAKVLSDMQSSTEADNENRKQQGYQPMHLVGWAQPPAYDAQNHALVWARELKLEGDPVDGLNYDVRLLGRTGVLSLNMLSSMSEIANVRSAAQSFGKAVTFEPGAGYADFDQKTDKSAEYGLAGLVAGGVALGVAQKVGLLAIVLKFGKLILIALAAGGAGAWQFIKRLIGRKDDGEQA